MDDLTDPFEYNKKLITDYTTKSIQTAIDFLDSLSLENAHPNIKNKICGLGILSQDFSIVSEKDWIRLCEAFSKSPIVQFSLPYANLYMLSEYKWLTFCEALSKQSTITTLKLPSNRIDLLKKNRIEAFCIALRSNRNLRELDLGTNFLGLMGAERLELLLAAINISTITDLNLSHNGFSLLGKIEKSGILKILGHFFRTNTTLRKLDLSYWNWQWGEQEYIDPQCQTAFENTVFLEFCKAFSGNWGIKDLTITVPNDLCWTFLCQMIEKNRTITRLTVLGNMRIKSSDCNNLMLSITQNQTVNEVFLSSNIDCMPYKTWLKEFKKYLADRHRRALVFAYCLSKHKLPDQQGLHTRYLPVPIQNKILSFFETRDLCAQVRGEVRKHNVVVDQLGFLERSDRKFDSKGGETRNLINTSNKRQKLDVEFVIEEEPTWAETIRSSCTVS